MQLQAQLKGLLKCCHSWLVKGAPQPTLLSPTMALMAIMAVLMQSSCHVCKNLKFSSFLAVVFRFVPPYQHSVTDCVSYHFTKITLDIIELFLGSIDEFPLD